MLYLNMELFNPQEEATGNLEDINILGWLLMMFILLLAVLFGGLALLFLIKNSIRFLRSIVFTNEMEDKNRKGINWGKD